MLGRLGRRGFATGPKVTSKVFFDMSIGSEKARMSDDEATLRTYNFNHIKVDMKLYHVVLLFGN